MRSMVVGSWSVPSILASVCCNEYRIAIHASSAAAKTFANFSFRCRLERGVFFGRLRKRYQSTARNRPAVNTVIGCINRMIGRGAEVR
jgi:hypothetical protein